MKMNLLSVGASYGLLVLVFQKGFMIDIFGFEQVDQLEFWLPLFMFSILFGLSMDYHVFMLMYFIFQLPTFKYSMLKNFPLF